MYQKPRQFSSHSHIFLCKQTKGCMKTKCIAYKYFSDYIYIYINRQSLPIFIHISSTSIFLRTTIHAYRTENYTRNFTLVRHHYFVISHTKSTNVHRYASIIDNTFLLIQFLNCLLKFVGFFLIQETMVQLLCLESCKQLRV